MSGSDTSIEFSLQDVVLSHDAFLRSLLAALLASRLVTVKMLERTFGDAIDSAKKDYDMPNQAPEYLGHLYGLLPWDDWRKIERRFRQSAN